MIVGLCAGFLLAVLWMDLMFDVQVLRAPRPPAPLPEPILASIAGYYRRVTAEARPMNRLIGAVMVIMLFAVLAELVRDPASDWVAIASFPLAVFPTALAAARVFPNAVRLGGRVDPPERQSALARAICRDHLICLAAIAALIALRLAR